MYFSKDIMEVLAVVATLSSLYGCRYLNEEHHIFEREMKVGIDVNAYWFSKQFHVS